MASLGLSGGEYASANEMDAVPRKAENIAQNQAAAVEKKDPPSQASPAPSEPPKEMTDEELDAKYDKAVYLDMQSRLRQMKHVNNVHTLFEEMKPKIKEIRQRNSEAAQHIIKLFLDAEDNLTKGEA